MAVCSGTLKKVTCPVYKCTIANTGQVNFYKVQGPISNNKENRNFAPPPPPPGGPPPKKIFF